MSLQQLILSQLLSQRQKLLQNLEQTQRIQQTQKLNQIQYQEREDICTRLYADAFKRGNVREYAKHGMRYEFALVSKHDVPSWVYYHTGHAFAHCLMDAFVYLFHGEKYARARGSWLLFVIHDMYSSSMPSWVIEYASVHERGEMVTLGDHNIASRLEFAVAAKERKLGKYINWIGKNYPSKFADVFVYQMHFPFIRNEEFMDTLRTFQKSDEAKTVHTLIQKFEWPVNILKKLNSYKLANDKIINILKKHLSTALVYASEPRLSLKEIAENIYTQIHTALSTIKEKKLDIYINNVRINEEWEGLVKVIGDEFSRTMTFRQNLLPQQEYIQELIAANAERGGLPNEGVFSSDFQKAFLSI